MTLSGLPATIPVQHKYIGNCLEELFSTVSGFDESEINSYGYPNSHSRLRYEHRFGLKIHFHYTVEPWHENTCDYSGGEEMGNGEGMNSFQFALRPSSTLVI